MNSEQSQDKHVDIVGLAIVISLVLLIVITLILGSVPPVSRDALTHHLAVPKIWIEKGLFTELPAIPFSYYPMNLDLLYLIPLYLGNDIVPKYIHFSFALFTAFLIYAHLKRRLSILYGLLGALCFLSVPVIVKLSITVYVDLGLIFFSTAALFSLINWFENGHRKRYLFFSAIWCGFALGTKYNGLIVLFLLACFIPVLYLRRSDDGTATKKSWRSQLAAIGCGAMFVCIALLVFSPWMAKNIHMTGNPLHPLYGGFFKNSDERQPFVDSQTITPINNKKIVSKNPGWKNFAVRKIIYGEPIWQISLIPLRVFFEGRDDDPKHFDGQLNPFLLILPLMLFLPGNRTGCNRRGECRILALFAIGYMVFVFFRVDMRVRWISPIIPPLIILSMYGLERVYNLGHNSNVRWKRFFFRGAVVITTLVMLGINARYIYTLWNKVDPVPYISGQIDRDAYIQRFRPEYEIISHINRQLPEDAKILCLFIGNRIYYFDRSIRWDASLLEKVLASSESIDDIRSGLKKAGITHLMIRYDLTNAWASNSLDKKQQGLLQLFIQKYAKMIKSHRGYGLFEIDYTE